MPRARGVASSYRVNYRAHGAERPRGGQGPSLFFLGVIVHSSPAGGSENIRTSDGCKISGRASRGLTPPYFPTLSTAPTQISAAAAICCPPYRLRQNRAGTGTRNYGAPISETQKERTHAVQSFRVTTALLRFVCIYTSLPIPARPPAYLPACLINRTSLARSRAACHFSLLPPGFLTQSWALHSAKRTTSSLDAITRRRRRTLSALVAGHHTQFSRRRSNYCSIGATSRRTPAPSQVQLHT